MASGCIPLRRWPPVIIEAIVLPWETLEGFLAGGLFLLSYFGSWTRELSGQDQEALREVQIETYPVSSNRIISCGRLDTKFALVTSIPVRDVHILKQQSRLERRRRGGGVWKEVTK